MAITEGIRTEIDSLGVRDRAPGLAALAIGLAEQFDAAVDSPSAAAALAQQLRAVMATLRQMPPAAAVTGLDRVKQQREKRRGG